LTDDTRAAAPAAHGLVVMDDGQRARLATGLGDPGATDSTPVTRALAWLSDFICEPHEQLGRDGPICPFVPASIRADSLEVQEWRANPRSGRAELGALIDRMAQTFLTLNWPSRNPTLHALVVVLTGLGPGHGDLLDLAQSDAKSRLVPRGLMLGQFHPDCDERAARNPEFRVSRSPVPLLAMRRMAFHDVLFLHSKAEWFAAYRQRFGMRYVAGAALDPVFVDAYAKACATWGYTENGQTVDER
jgi:heptaprenyl diphosphate synthase